MTMYLNNHFFKKPQKLTDISEVKVHSWSGWSNVSSERIRLREKVRSGWSGEPTIDSRDDPGWAATN